MLVFARSVHDRQERARGNCRSLVEGHNQNYRPVSDPRCHLVQGRLRSALALSHNRVLRFCLRSRHEVLLAMLEAAIASTAFRGGMHTMAVFLYPESTRIPQPQPSCPFTLAILTAILQTRLSSFWITG